MFFHYIFNLGRYLTNFDAIIRQLIKSVVRSLLFNHVCFVFSDRILKWSWSDESSDRLELNIFTMSKGHHE